MTRNLFIFLGTFVLGALIALAARTATHQPHAVVAAADAHAQHRGTPTERAGAAAPHAQHPPAIAGKPTDTSAKPVNTVCAICGMDVDPKVPTAQYQGKAIGFGCKMCPPKFAAEPDKYGPYYLRNEVFPR